MKEESPDEGGVWLPDIQLPPQVRGYGVGLRNPDSSEGGRKRTSHSSTHCMLGIENQHRSVRHFTPLRDPSDTHESPQRAIKRQASGKYTTQRAREHSCRGRRRTNATADGQEHAETNGVQETTPDDGIGRQAVRDMG